MAERPRKTLGLPPRPKGEAPLVDPRRKPVRGGVGARKPGPHPNAGRPSAPAGETPEKPGGKRPPGPQVRGGQEGRARTAQKPDERKPGERKPRAAGASATAPARRDGERPSGKPERPSAGGRPERAPRTPGADARRSGEAAPPGRKPAASPRPAPRPRAEAVVERAAPARASASRPAAPAPAAAAAPPSGVRVSKLMAERGLCSRREADAFIERGWVFVDGQRINELGTRADPAATITLAREARANQQRQMTLLLNKPVGYVSGQPEPGFTPAVTLIQPENQYRTPDTPLFHPTHLKGLAPAGRLDIDSTGLLVLTQDGRVARQLIGEDSKVEKEYLVRVEGTLVANGLALLNHGLSLDGKPLRPARVEWLNEDQLRFVLREGKKRQIRRMCELVGLKVVGLKRIRIGNVRLGDLPVGQWRFLREDEAF